MSSAKVQPCLLLLLFYLFIYLFIYFFFNTALQKHIYMHIGNS